MTAKNAPKSLFSLCLKLVAENLDIVDHFLGFPSLIGEKIFRAAEDCNRWSDHTYVSTAINLFTEAFEAEVLSSLNLSGQYLGVNFYLPDLLLFRHIVKLDVSCCGLGDDHELLAHVTHLERLEELSLRNDCLSDRGIQKMTAPYRMFKRGPADIHTIDMSGNMDITEKCLKYLTTYPCMQTVFLPCGLNTPKEGVTGWNLSSSGTGKFPAIPTEGWASRLVQSWMVTATEKAQQKKKKKSNFYSNGRKERALKQSSPKIDSVTPGSTIATRRRPPTNQVIKHRNIHIQDSRNMEYSGLYDSILKDNLSCMNRTGNYVGNQEKESESPSSICDNKDLQSDGDTELLNMYSNANICRAGKNENISPGLGLLDQYQPERRDDCSNTAVVARLHGQRGKPASHGIILPVAVGKRKWGDVDNASTLSGVSVRLNYSNPRMRASYHRSMPVKSGVKLGSQLHKTGASKFLSPSSVTAVDLGAVKSDSLTRAKLPPAKKIKLVKSVTRPSAGTVISANTNAQENAGIATTAAKSSFLNALDSY